jgi:hypothetical protein
MNDQQEFSTDPRRSLLEEFQLLGDWLGRLAQATEPRTPAVVRAG